jgi:nucleoside-diphosphate-sugar epimerase
MAPSTKNNVDGNKKAVAILGAGGYLAGPIARHLKDAGGYHVIGFVRPSTDASALTSEIADVVCKGDLRDPNFLVSSIQEHTSSSTDDGQERYYPCVAIINFINQLMPPCDTVLKQLDNDLPPLMAGLEAALKLNCVFVHTSGNFAIPTAGNMGGTFTTELPAKPALVLDPSAASVKTVEELEHWDTFAHDGGLTAVATLAEAKHREDWAVADFVAAHGDKVKACVLIPAGVYGPGIGSKISFWDYAAAQFLDNTFADFAHAFLHIEDAAQVYLTLVNNMSSTPSNMFPGGECKRFAAYGESMTVRDFVAKYSAACGVPMLADNEGAKCSEEERKRVYDDSASREVLGVAYVHTLRVDSDKRTSSSLKEAVENLRVRNMLMVQE